MNVKNSWRERIDVCLIAKGTHIHHLLQLRKSVVGIIVVFSNNMHNAPSDTLCKYTQIACVHTKLYIKQPQKKYLIIYRTAKDESNGVSAYSI